MQEYIRMGKWGNKQIRNVHFHFYSLSVYIFAMPHRTTNSAPHIHELFHNTYTLRKRETKPKIQFSIVTV